MAFREATTVVAIDSHTYEAQLRKPWIIGTVPHGGYSTSCIQRAVTEHFSTTLSKYKQPHTLALHLTFVRRTSTGPARIHIKDVKLGRQTSTVHVSLQQDGREEIVGYVTQGNLSTERGASYETNWDIHPRPVPMLDFAKLDTDTEPQWTLKRRMPFPDFRTATGCVDLYNPRQGQFSPSIVDQWMRLKNGERWTNEALGYVADTFPQMIEHFVIQSNSWNTGAGREYTWEEHEKLVGENARSWYPTLLLNLDVKKALPDEGAEWLFLRLEAKQIRNGRYDLEVIIRDANNELVALSHHSCLVVSAERNLAARSKGGDTKL